MHACIIGSASESCSKQYDFDSQASPGPSRVQLNEANRSHKSNHYRQKQVVLCYLQEDADVSLFMPNPILHLFSWRFHGSLVKALIDLGSNMILKNESPFSFLYFSLVLSPFLSLCVFVSLSHVCMNMYMSLCTMFVNDVCSLPAAVYLLEVKGKDWGIFPCYLSFPYLLANLILS